MTKRKAHKKESSAEHKTSAHKTTHNSSHAKKDEWYTKPTTWIIAVLAVIVVILLLNDGGSNTAVEYTGDGVVIIEEFTDVGCPFCARVQPTLDAIKSKYGDNVELVFKHYPVAQLHPNAPKAHEALECAKDQGFYQAYHDMLFANQQAQTIPSLKQYAANLGLDTATFNTCLDSGEKKAIVDADVAEGRSKGVRGTPTFFINGQQLVGAQPLSEFEKIIDAELAKMGGSNTGSADSTTGATAQVSDTSNDPEIEMIVLNDATCEVCNTEQIITVTQTDIFPTAVVTEVDVSSAEGQAMLETYGVNALPAYFFSSEVTEAANYGQLSSQGALVANEDLYQIVPAAVGANYYLSGPEITENDHVYGNMDAPITVVEYSDFLCSFCGAASGESASGVSMMQGRDPSWIAPVPELKALADAGEIKFVYKHYLRTDASEVPIRASECAADQGMFWEYHDVLFANQDKIMSGLSTDGYTQYAVDLGMDESTFMTCMETKDVSELTTATLAEAQAFGISGTPGFMVENYQLSGAVSFSQFESLIDSIQAE